MQIHKLGYKIDNPDDLENYPQFILTLDGVAVSETLMVFPLEFSSQKDGIYPIINCSCGEWGCGGAYIQVKNEPREVIWENFYSMWYDPETPDKKYEQKIYNLYDFPFKAPLVFIRDQYQEIIKSLLTEKDKFIYEKRIYDYDVKRYSKNSNEFYPF